MSTPNPPDANTALDTNPVNPSRPTKDIYYPGHKYKIVPKPHRCADHLDDFIVALQTWPLEVKEPWLTFWKCHFTDSNDPNIPPRYKRTTPISYTPSLEDK